MIQSGSNTSVTATITTTSANQGTPAADANGWPVKVTDGTHEAAIDNTTELEVSSYGTGGVAGDTPIRVPTQVINIPAQAVTAGTPVTVLTPTAGKKWRLHGGHLGLSVAGSVLIKDAGTEKLRTGQLLAGSSTPIDVKNGALVSAAANNTLQIDASASGTVSGYLLVSQE
jgi:hypothetical protein